MERRYFAEKERCRKLEARIAELEDEALYVTSDAHILQDELAEARNYIAVLEAERPPVEVTEPLHLPRLVERTTPHGTYQEWEDAA